MVIIPAYDSEATYINEKSFERELRDLMNDMSPLDDTELEVDDE